MNTAIAKEGARDNQGNIVLHIVKIWGKLATTDKNPLAATILDCNPSDSHSIKRNPMLIGYSLGIKLRLSESRLESTS